VKVSGKAACDGTGKIRARGRVNGGRHREHGRMREASRCEAHVRRHAAARAQKKIAASMEAAMKGNE
jgi:hypothetical protein